MTVEEALEQSDKYEHLYIKGSYVTGVLAAEVRRLREENGSAMREASYLATALWRLHYQKDAPDFKLCDTAAGIITQIDNMTAGLGAEVRRLREVNDV